MSDDLDALDALIASPGWRLFLEHVKGEWSPGACWRKAHETDADIPRIDYTNRQVGLLMDWPKAELDRLKRTERQSEAPVSRGGYHP